MTGFRAFVRSIRFRILMIAALCWLLPMLTLGLYLGGVFSGAVRRQTEAALMSAAHTAESATVVELDRIVKLAKSVTYDSEVEESVAAYQSGEINYTDLYRTSRIYLDRKFFRERAFSFALLYMVDKPTQYMATTGSNEMVQNFVRNAQSDVMALGETLDTACRFVSRRGTTYLVRNLFNKKLKRFGMLVIGIEPDRVLAPLLTGNPLWQDAIDVELDEFRLRPGSLPPMEGDQALQLSEYQRELLLDGQVSTRDFTLRYRAHVDKRQVYGQIEEYNRLMLILLLLLLPIEALIMVFVQRRLIRPLRTLADASHQIEQGVLGVTVPMTGHDEVGQLGRGYNAMSLQIKQLIEKSFEEELVLRDARIEALQSRINPHFLNNTLEMINWQARMEGSSAISGMIEAMSTLINASLDRTNRRVVPLSEELSVAEAYFFFLTHRFGDKLRVEREIDPMLLGESVPRLVIQTLLENAVDHGIAPVGGGLIRLRIYREGAQMRIDVTNNGKRLTEEDERRIGALLSAGDQDIGPKLEERMGIRNVNRRAKLLFGERAGLTLMRDPGGDTLARLELPMDTAKQDELV